MRYLEKLNEEDIRMLAGDVARFIVHGWYDTTGTDDRSIEISDEIRREYLEYLDDEITKRIKSPPYYEYQFGVTHKHEEDTLKEDFEAAKEECDWLRHTKRIFCLNRTPIKEKYVNDHLQNTILSRHSMSSYINKFGKYDVLVLKVGPTDEYPDGYHHFFARNTTSSKEGTHEEDHTRQPTQDKSQR